MAIVTMIAIISSSSSSPRAQLGVKLRTYIYIIIFIYYDTARARNANVHGWQGHSIILYCVQCCIIPVPSTVLTRVITRATGPQTS
jgi:hypothetical protein